MAGWRNAMGNSVNWTGGAALGSWMDKQGAWGHVGSTALGLAPLTYGRDVVSGDKKWDPQYAKRQFSAYNAYEDMNYKKRRDAEASALLAGNADAQGREQDYNAQASNLDAYKYQDDAARGKALTSLDSGYGNRGDSYQQAYDANLKSALSGLGAQYQQGSQQSALQNAKRGRTGSSYAAETQAGLQDQYRTGAMGAANDAWGYSQQLSDTDYQQQQALRRAILSGDPQSGAAYQAQAAGANNQASSLAGMSALSQQQRQINQLYGNAQSQQLGGYGQAGANYVNSRYGQYGA